MIFITNIVLYITMCKQQTAEYGFNRNDDDLTRPRPIIAKFERFSTEASMDPRDVEIKSPRPSYFMLTCLGILRHDDKKYVNMST